MGQSEIDAKILDVVGNADRDVAQAALARAAEVMKKRTAFAARHAEMLQTISRLAAATNCPADTDVAEWLQELGLIEPDGVGGFVVTPKANLRSVKDS